VVIATSNESDEITSKSLHVISVLLTDDYTIDDGSRIVGKIYAAVSGSGNAPSVALYYEGDEDSAWEIPVNINLLDGRYLKTDQSTPQTVSGGAPTFEGGIIAPSIETAADDLDLSPASGIVKILTSGTDGGYRAYDATGAYYIGIDHTGATGRVISSHGYLQLSSLNADVQVMLPAGQEFGVYSGATRKAGIGSDGVLDALKVDTPLLQPSGGDQVIKLGDDAGTKVVLIKNVNDEVVTRIDSMGKTYLYGSYSAWQGVVIDDDIWLKYARGSVRGQYSDNRIQFGSITYSWGSVEIYSCNESDIHLGSVRDVIITLGDSAGGNKVSIEDSDGAEVASIDSNGDFSGRAGEFDTLKTNATWGGLTLWAGSAWLKRTASDFISIELGTAGDHPLKLAPANDLVIKLSDAAGARKTSIVDNGLVEKASIDSLGNFTWKGNLAHEGGNVGFYGATPVTQPTITGVRGGGGTANLLSALADLGLVVDNTTAAKGEIKLPVGSPAEMTAQIDQDKDLRLLFDDTTVEHAVWQFKMPDDYGGNLVAKIQYTMASATSGKVDFEVSVMAVSGGDAQDLDADSYDTVNAGNATVPGTAGYLGELTITLTNDDDVAAGDYVRVKLEDVRSSNPDKATGDCEVRNVVLEYEVA